MTTSTKKANGGFVLNVTGNQTVNGELVIDASALVGESKKAGVIKFTFNNFVTSGDCTITFEGNTKQKSETYNKQ